MNRVLYLIVLVYASVCSCSTGEPAVRPPGKDDEEKVLPEPRFAAGAESAHTAGPEEGRIHLIIYRDADRATPEADYEVVASVHDGFAKVPARVVFAPGGRETTLTIEYGPAAIPGKRRVTVALRGTGASHTAVIDVRGAGSWADAGNVVLYDCGKTTRCMLQVSGNDGRDYRAVDADGRCVAAFRAGDDGELVPASTEGYAAAMYAADNEATPAHGAASRRRGAMYALNVCEVSAAGVLSEPRVVYIIDEAVYAERFVRVRVADGWLVPAVWLDARPPVPGTAWDCAGELTADGRLAVYDPYRNMAPFNTLNGAPCGSAWMVSIDGERATIEPQEACFVNDGLFASTFRIEAREGRIERDAGGFAIEWSQPMHNRRLDGSMDDRCGHSWAEPWPTRLYVSSISAM